MRPLFTRLRWLKAKKESTIERYLRTLNFRVEIKEIIWKEKEGVYVVWLVPPDEANKDVLSQVLKD